ncbi:hypothetical protein [Chitinophaga deserti]|uniref:hypothetical protein n=1 Tax=Chitinophaga deserti TaxID=2164099 RepID=UPI001E642C0A|nr:hypothetical protein [Chitinophaga deserti]
MKTSKSEIKPVTVHELKKEMLSLPQAELVEMCLRLAKFKKENKELLSYLLFDASYPETYLDQVRGYIDMEFDGMGTTHAYHAKKTVRKILRVTNKHIRFTQSKTAEIELLLHFCKKLRRAGDLLKNSVQLSNLYFQQLRKIDKTIAAQHEDLQYDYRRELDALMKV